MANERTKETVSNLKKVVGACGKRGANLRAIVVKTGLEEPRVRYLLDVAKAEGLVEFRGSRRTGMYVKLYVNSAGI